VRRAFAAVLFATALCAVACGGSSPKATRKPLSTLGHLQPAPSPGTLGPELIPIPNAPSLAPPASKASPTHTVDGIKCQRDEKLVFHIHAHLTLFVGGKARSLPGGIGVWPKLEKQSGLPGQFVLTQGECLSWLITRFSDGLVHIEAPVKRSFVLGELFDVWGQPLGPNVLGPAKGKVTAIVDGQVWDGDPRRIPLTSHAQIQLEVGRPLVAPEHITFPGAF
jgi:hypothetical protein